MSSFRLAINRHMNKRVCQCFMPVSCSIIIWATFQFSRSPFCVTSTFIQWVSITALNHHMFTQLLLIHFLSSWLIALYSMKWTVRRMGKQSEWMKQITWSYSRDHKDRWPLAVTEVVARKWWRQTNWQTEWLSDCLQNRDRQTGKLQVKERASLHKSIKHVKNVCHWCRTTILKLVKFELKRWFCNAFPIVILKN